jgi:protein-S-isoprenylcysteine O-methyltransferase Ste14
MTLPQLHEWPSAYLAFASLHLLAGHFGSSLVHRIRFGRTPLVLYRAPRSERHTRVSQVVALLACIWALLLIASATSARARSVFTFFGYMQPPLWVGWCIAIAGLLMMLVSQWNMGAAFRIGQSHEDAPSALRTTGLHRYSRNPIYVGSWTMLAGMTAWYPHPLAVLALSAVGYGMHLLVCAEEQFLARQFGDVYTQYCARTPRYVGLP